MNVADETDLINVLSSGEVVDTDVFLKTLTAFFNMAYHKTNSGNLYAYNTSKVSNYFESITDKTEFTYHVNNLRSVITMFFKVRDKDDEERNINLFDAIVDTYLAIRNYTIALESLNNIVKTRPLKPSENVKVRDIEESINHRINARNQILIALTDFMKADLKQLINSNKVNEEEAVLINKARETLKNIYCWNKITSSLIKDESN